MTQNQQLINERETVNQEAGLKSQKMDKLIEYLLKYDADWQEIQYLAKYSTPQEAWDNMESKDLVWVATKTNLVSDEDKKRFARWCALSVAHIWDMPEVVRRYLESGDEGLREEALTEARKIAINATPKTKKRELTESVRQAMFSAAWAAVWITKEKWDAESAAWNAASAEWNKAPIGERNKTREAARSLQAAWIRSNIKPNWEVIE